jgi:hypothetical protein
MLSASLAMASGAAGLGIAERLAPAVNVLVMVTIFGATFVLPDASVRQPAVEPLVGAGAPLVALLLAQSLKPARWKLWLAAGAILSSMISAVFLQTIAGP